MFIEYSRDAIEKTEYSILKKSLDHSCTAMRDRNHVVCTENRYVADRICTIMKNDQQIPYFYDKLSECFSQIAAIKNEVDVFVRIVPGNASSKATTSNGKKVISIGIQRTLEKYFWRETVFVTENPSDHDAYKIICEENNPHGICIEFDPQNGGGSTTPAVIQDLTKDHYRLILCAIDGDKHNPSADFGDTAKRTITALKNMVLCNIFVIESLEIENLFLTEEIVRCLDNNKLSSDHERIISSLKKAQCIHEKIWFFYDVKKGFRYKNIKNNQYLLEAFKCNIQSCQKDISKCSCKSCDNIVIENFGGDYLKNVITCDRVTSQIHVLYSQFPQYMQDEWIRIAKIILSWCCAYHLNVLGA